MCWFSRNELTKLVTCKDYINTDDEIVSSTIIVTDQIVYNHIIEI